MFVPFTDATTDLQWTLGSRSKFYSSWCRAKQLAYLEAYGDDAWGGGLFRSGL